MNGRAYRFSVVAVNRVGSGPTARTPAVAPAGVPAQVKGVHAAARVKAAVIRWMGAKANGSPVTGYRIVASTGEHRSVGAKARSLRFDNLVSGLSYRFRVRAVNAIGSGRWSAWTPSITVR